jgi:NitT/TauT family transport system permease protein
MNLSISMRNRIQSAALLIAILGVWELLVRSFAVSAFVLPAPSAIATRFIQLLTSGIIWPHLLATLTSIVSGMLIGSLLGLLCGGLISLIPIIDRLVYPYVVAIQTVPKIAIAPLFIVWFGYGITSKIVITALLCFFPVLVSVIAGFRSVDRDQLEMMRALGASSWQILIRLRMPAALVLIFAGLEIAAVLAVIGAVVGEFVGAQKGLGYLITSLNFNLDIAGVFAVLIYLAMIGLALHGLVRYARARSIFWIRAEPDLVMV